MISPPERPPRAPAHRVRRPPPQVHHNPWESLQHMKWHDALNRVDKRLAYMSPSERMSTRMRNSALNPLTYTSSSCEEMMTDVRSCLYAVVPLDPRIRANKAIAELGAPFLDRGLAKWDPPNRERG